MSSESSGVIVPIQYNIILYYNETVDSIKIKPVFRIFSSFRFDNDDA